MPRPRDTSSDDGSWATSTFSAFTNSPLVIVSEQGRHSEASRRLVRAQAARASAAASRVTRARNREEREGGARSDGARSEGLETPIPDPPQQPPARPSTQSRQSSYGTKFSTASLAGALPLSPLVEWVGTVITNPAEVLRGGASILTGTVPATAQSAFSGITSAVSPAAIINTVQAPHSELSSLAGKSETRQLPVALPKGFAALQQRLLISESFITFVSNTACFGKLHTPLLLFTRPSSY